jgi:hypothetical protein
MGVKIKHTDPTLNSFSTDDLVVNVKGGSLFFKSNTELFRIKGDTLTTTVTESFGDELWHRTGNNLYYTSGSVGIGTTSPDAKLEVAADGTTSQEIAHFGNSNGVGKIKLQIDGAGSSKQVMLDATNNEDIVLSTQGDSYFNISHGNVGIGTDTPSSKLDVNGTITATGTNFSSDINLKTNINNIKTPLETISKLKGVTFDWKDHIIETDKTLQGTKHGLIAQEVEKILPNLVHTNKTKSVSYIEIIPILIEAIKEQQNQIDELKNKINE